MAIGNRLSRRVGARFDRFDPNAIDGDNDGLVQEQTSFERPATIRNRAVTGSVSAINRPEPGSQRLDEAMAAVKGSEPEHRIWARIANENGWAVRKAPGGHIQYISPDPSVPIVTTGATGLGGRGIKNVESDLRRNGLPIPRKGAKPKSSTAFALEESAPKIDEEKLAEAMRFAAATQKDRQKISIDDFIELLDIEEDMKPELIESVNKKFPGYFNKPENTDDSSLTRREQRRGIVRGSISSPQEGKKPIAPKSLFKEAEAAGVSLDAILDDSDFDNDVEWSSNSWSIGKKKVQQAGDAVIVRNNKDGKPEVLMIRRKTAPFTDGYALPGGLLDEGETFEQTVDREMEEEVGVPASKADSRRYLGDIKAKDWDPRFVEGVHVGATRFDVPENTDVVAGSDAKGAEWVSVEDLANGKHRIGFGHAAWLSLAFENDTELSRKFDILARASRHRNQEIIRRVNEKRKEAGAKLFTGLESPNKHYIPEGTGPLGVRKVNNLGFDLAKVITRNPGFFDKRTEEIFKYRASNSSAETAKKFGMTQRELDDTLLESTQKLEKKIRKDIADRMKKNGRKQNIAGSISSPIIGSDPIARAEKRLKLTERQKEIATSALRDLHESFENGEIYNMPIHERLESRKKELLDSIRIEIASDGTPMIMAEPNPLVTPYHAIQRDWASIEVPTGKPVRDMLMKLISKQSEVKIDDEYGGDGSDKFYGYLYDIINREEDKGGQVDYRIGGTDSWPQAYLRSLRDFRAGSVILEYSDGLHDMFGHFGTGRGFDYHGEWANYLSFKDLINKNDAGLTKPELEELNRLWFREYGIHHVLNYGYGTENEELGDLFGGNLDNVRSMIVDYPGPIMEVIEMLDTGENGLGGVSGSKIIGSISAKKKSKQSGKKIKDITAAEFVKVGLLDATEKLNTRATSVYPSNRIYGAMGLMDDDAEVGEYVDYLKSKMTAEEWFGDEGQKVRDIVNEMFNIDISKERRDSLVDDLLDIEVNYMDREPEDDFDYALDNLGEENKEWKEYLSYLEETDPDEYEFWKDYNPNTGFSEEEPLYQPSLFDEPWDRPTPNLPKGKKNNKRKIFGWRRNNDKPSKRINKIKFYGHDKMREKQEEQLELFRKWKNEKNWKALHNAHYDWWAFPIDRGSAAYGDGYNVAGDNINKLVSDKKYMDNLVELASIYSEAMGWDIVNRDWIKDLDWDRGQDPWAQAYGARLYKIARALQIFGLKDEYDSFSLMVESLRADDGLRRRIGKSQYWDNPDVPFNKITPGTKRHARKMRAEFGDSNPTKKPRRKKITGSMAVPPRQPSGSGRRGFVGPNQPRERFIRELNVDDWYIFSDDLNDYLEKVKKRDVKISTQDYRELMKAVAIFASVDAVPTDDNGISVNMSDEQVKQLRIVLKKISSMENNFFNIDDIYNSLPTKERPKTIEAGGPNV
jgi:ADP-ribose pyrophosphatase YjhB (NUDIX family)